MHLIQKILNFNNLIISANINIKYNDDNTKLYESTDDESTNDESVTINENKSNDDEFVTIDENKSNDDEFTTVEIKLGDIISDSLIICNAKDIENLFTTIHKDIFNLQLKDIKNNDIKNEYNIIIAFHDLIKRHKNILSPDQYNNYLTNIISYYNILDDLCNEIDLNKLSTLELLLQTQHTTTIINTYIEKLNIIGNSEIQDQNKINKIYDKLKKSLSVLELLVPFIKKISIKNEVLINELTGNITLLKSNIANPIQIESKGFLSYFSKKKEYVNLSLLNNSQFHSVLSNIQYYNQVTNNDYYAQMKYVKNEFLCPFVLSAVNGAAKFIPVPGLKYVIDTKARQYLGDKNFGQVIQDGMVDYAFHNPKEIGRYLYSGAQIGLSVTKTSVKMMSSLAGGVCRGVLYCAGYEKKQKEDNKN